MKILIGVIVLALLGTGIYFYMQNASTGPVESNVQNMETKESTPSASGMPENWPDDVPGAFAGAQILSSQSKSAVTGKENPTMLYNVSATWQAVVDYYRSGLSTNGWVIGAPFEAQGIVTITATKDTRSVALYVSETNGIVSVTAGVTLE